MINKLIAYIERLFEDAPRTKKTLELKDEIKANCIEKYNDLLTTGKTEEEAYNIVVGGIGDINELIDTLNEDKNYDINEQKRAAKYKAIAIMLYIISVTPVIILDYFGEGAEIVGIFLMFLMIGVATAILVYTAASKPKYIKAEETLVEEFKEWQAEKSKEKAIRNTISSIFWTIIVAIYLFVSFLYNAWPFSWIIFIIGAAIDQIIKLIFQLKRS